MFEVNTLPPENVAPPAIMMEESNWLQNLEGDTDSNHLDYLHSRLDAFRLRLFGEEPKVPQWVLDEQRARNAPPPSLRAYPTA